jgi:hypothetical protein
MPIRQVLILFTLLGLCLALVGLAWANGYELFLYLPSRRGHAHHPPTHPGVIFATMIFSVLLAIWFRQWGVYVFTILSAGMVLGSLVGYFAFGWTPSWTQHFLTVAMIATSIYAWMQKEYFED